MFGRPKFENSQQATETEIANETPESKKEPYGRVADPEIAHEMADIEAPYHKKRWGIFPPAERSVEVGKQRAEQHRMRGIEIQESELPRRVRFVLDAFKSYCAMYPQELLRKELSKWTFNNKVSPEEYDRNPLSVALTSFQGADVKVEHCGRIDPLTGQDGNYAYRIEGTLNYFDGTQERSLDTILAVDVLKGFVVGVAPYIGGKVVGFSEQYNAYSEGVNMANQLEEANETEVLGETATEHQSVDQ